MGKKKDAVVAALGEPMISPETVRPEVLKGTMQDFVEVQQVIDSHQKGYQFLRASLAQLMQEAHTLAPEEPKEGEEPQKPSVTNVKERTAIPRKAHQHSRGARGERASCLRDWTQGFTDSA